MNLRKRFWIALGFGWMSLVPMSCGNGDGLFREVNGKKLGIEFRNSVGQTEIYNILTFEHLFNGGGVAIDDFDGDGKMDVFFTGNIVDNKLFLNRGDLEFIDISEAAEIQASGKWCSGVTTVDINQDGLRDIYVNATLFSDANRRKNMLFVNQGMSTENGFPVFIDEAEKYGIADVGHSTQSVFFDYDQDGDLDLYVLTNQLEVRSPNKFFFKRLDGSAPNTDRLYRNNGDGSFNNVSKEAGILIEGYGLSLNVLDFNKDGWLDIYISNDYLSNDVLYINNQDGTFTDRISEYVKHQSHSSMGSDVADVNNDGLPDIITVEMLPRDMKLRKRMWPAETFAKTVNNEKLGYDFQYMRNMLQVHQGHDINGNPRFGEMAFLSGLEATEWSWSSLFNDYDADGDKDLFISNGFPKDITDMDFVAFKSATSMAYDKKALLDALPESKVLNYFFENQGDLAFKNVSEDWGIESPSFSNGAAYGDLDNDGDLDLVINNINDNATVLINQSKDIQYLVIELDDGSGDTKSLGASVDVFVGNKQMSQHFMPVRGYLSCMEPMLYFGLGAATQVDSIHIRWADGRLQKEGASPANRRMSIGYAPNVTPNESNPDNTIQLFQDLSEEIDFVHLESPFIDFNIQRLLPRQYSLMGPALAAGDVDQNGEVDFIVGGSTASVPRLYRANGESFIGEDLEVFDHALQQEDAGILLFDADLDGDLDAYIASGGYEQKANTSAYLDRIFVNDGKGKFQYDIYGLPVIVTSNSCVKGCDYDQDGDIDLFVGGRIHPGLYPKPVSSYLLRNDSKEKDQIRFSKVNDSQAPVLNDLGLVSDACWADFDGDGWMDLIVVGEWMAPRFFKNQQGKLVDISPQTGLADKTGWWNSIVSGDFDNDGDTDFVAGNLGNNSFFQASANEPLYVYAKDFDQNQSLDAFLASSRGYNDGKVYPLHAWDDMKKQMNFLKNKTLKYETYAQSSVEALFSPEQLDSTLILQARFMHSAYIENHGQDSFSIQPLPAAAQVAPIHGMQVMDINDDRNLDLILVGNYFGTELFSGRYDALNGLVLYGDGAGGFQAENFVKNGFLVEEDARALIRFPGSDGKARILASQNKSSLRLFKLESDIQWIPLKTSDSWAILNWEDGKTRRVELPYGHSYYSQSSRHLALPPGIQSYQIYQSDGQLSLSN